MTPSLTGTEPPAPADESEDASDAGDESDERTLDDIIREYSRA